MNAGCRLICGALVILLGSGTLAATGQDAEQPTADERDTIRFCLGDALRKDVTAEICIDKVASPCMERQGGSSTQGMNACMYRENAIWDEILNAEYKALRRSLPKDTFEALRGVQRHWIAYRDAKCAYPYKAIDGTIASNFASSCVNTMTARRAIELRTWRRWEQGQ